jgi:SPP1 family predicted phage head-tail adaptor
MGSNMQAGKLRHRITIQSKALTPVNAYSESTAAWVAFVTIWAERAATSGNELVDQARLTPQTGWKYTIRHRTDLTTAMRVLDGARTCNIRTILEGNVPDEMVLDCEEVR